MKVYEIVNPSDYYTFEAESDLVADLAMLIVALGKMPPAALDGSFQGAFWLMGTTEDGLQKYFKEEHGRDEPLGDLIVQFRPQIADALESVVIGDRQLYFGALTIVEESKRGEFKAMWYDARRTSMNDIGGCCWRFAEDIRRQIAVDTAKEQT